MDPTVLQDLCERISEQFSVPALPAQIVSNRRWECLNDAAPENFPIAPPHRIKVSDAYGLVLYDWPKLTAEQQQSITAMCEAVR
ncbi:hypothetical protein CSB45_07125 [candidate division KSB3 bacterium]|uniref:Uncharacterized protein n=1 Tax=candidate division KSB3 bacterium TaxID=2044937 RepID=A0A2G6E685_9BACT|nr:MAG: hypothetical protein CSB45_07125 [candidate division KSB3 bacterium]PIE29998.1 MAG: hypothetical protein CSA57_05470 [candidate division KSB3 bacterium]